MNRRWDLDYFYHLLYRLRSRLGGYRYLSDPEVRLGCPKQGVYFFFEPGELRENRQELRVVRVGTHAVSQGSQATLWSRLAAHRGRLRGRHAGSGNHRGSIFRLHVGTALLHRGGYPEAVRETWFRVRIPREQREAEHVVEQDVSHHIRSMPFLWVAVPGPSGPDSHRKLIERNAIGLLSNRSREPIDPPSPSWLGHLAAHPAIRESGLWNVDHTDESYDDKFLELLEQYIFTT